MASSCSFSIGYDLHNLTGQDLTVESLSGSKWHKRKKVSAGQVGAKIPLNPNQRLRAGGCTYSYDVSWSQVPAARPAAAGPGMQILYRVVAGADFSLSLFPLSADGAVGPELVADGWPARPDVACASD